MACQRKLATNPSRLSSANPSSGGGRSVGGPPTASRSVVGSPARHAQDDMVVPTLRRGGGGGSGGGPPSCSRACGVVPVGRDSPIGLDLRRFLSAQMLGTGRVGAKGHFEGLKRDLEVCECRRGLPLRLLVKRAEQSEEGRIPLRQIELAMLL